MPEPGRYSGQENTKKVTGLPPAVAKAHDQPRTNRRTHTSSISTVASYLFLSASCDAMLSHIPGAEHTATQKSTYTEAPT